MQMCEKHWTMLREAIEARGLTPFIAKDGQEAMQQAIDQIEGDDTHYDPLAASNWLITGRALEMGGLYLMSGDYCPVCEVMKHMSQTPIVPGGPPAGEAWVEKHWIEGPADAALAECVRRGMVKTQ